jgi:hypothetical protein
MPQIPCGFGQNRGILFFAEGRRDIRLEVADRLVEVGQVKAEVVQLPVRISIDGLEPDGRSGAGDSATRLCGMGRIVLPAACNVPCVRA